MGLPSIGPMELIIILIIAMLILGPGRLAGAGGALGKAIRDFKLAASGEDEEPVGARGPREEAHLTDEAATARED